MATAYQGNKPYIFLSYAHIDRELAHSVIEYLQEHSFNVWYDEGIHTGTQWEDVIIDKIKNCWMMVFLVTKNSLASDWCRQELTFAKEKGKKFINVVIDNPAFPDWFNFSYKRYQFLYEEKFPNRKAMLDKLNSELIWHQPTDTPKETPKAKAPWVCKSCGSNNSGDDDVCEVCGSSDRYVAPKETPAPSPTEGLEFSIVDDTATVSDYTGTDTKVIITAKITYNGKTYKVTAIGEMAFFSCENITSITSPDSVTSIGESAFEGCDNLTSITIPNSVTSIGDYAFYECSSLTSITIPDSVTTIGEDAFWDCTNLTSITIPDSVTTIGDWTFKGCKNLTSITIPDSVTSIGDSAFQDCTNLTSITIPNSVTSIGESAFAFCDSLTSITIPDSVTSIGELAFNNCKNLTIYCEAKSKPKRWHPDWNPYNRPVVWGCESSKPSTDSTTTPKPSPTEGLEFSIVDGTAKVSDYKGTDSKVIIPATIIRDGKTYKVTSIEGWAFNNCKKLTSITIPNSVISIEDLPFFWCENLTSIDIDKNNTHYKSIDGNLYSKDGSTLLQYAAGKTATSFTIPNSVTSIGESAFRDCESITSITIPDGVTSIGKSAFWGCSSLTSIDVDKNNQNYKSIDGNLYSKDGTTLIKYAVGKTDTTFTIPDHVTTIGDEAFCGCKNITSITIPDSVASIGDYAFAHCKNLTSITIPESVTTIGESAFSYCTSLTSIIIPESVTTIGKSAFKWCTNLTSITIPDSVTSIGDYAFEDCKNLTSTTIPNSVTSIGKSAFVRCSCLTSITIPNSVTTIGEWAFFYCKKLTIYCEAKSKPEDWHENWNGYRPVVWGRKII